MVVHLISNKQRGSGEEDNFIYGVDSACEVVRIIMANLMNH